MKNALTIDLEDWYQTADFNFDLKDWDKYEDRVEIGTRIIMDSLERRNIKATFFVLGCVAKKHPELVKEIARMGHEIASHGSSHRLVYTQTMDEFREDIRASKNTLEDIVGKEVSFFRASSWSISKDQFWAYKVLEEEGFKCSSSLQPFKTPLSGVSGVPRTAFYPIIGGEKHSILEFPPTVLPLGSASIPFSGGLYLRTFPKSFMKYSLNKVNKKNNGMIYAHPWEFDIDQPRLDVPIHIKFTHYHNIKKTLNKFEFMLDNFKFCPLGEIIKDVEYPSIYI